MPLQLPLRIQITIIVFSLFCLTQVLTEYFNVDVLGQTLLAQAEQRAGSHGDRLTARLLPLMLGPNLGGADAIYLEFSDLEEMYLYDGHHHLLYHKVITPVGLTPPAIGAGRGLLDVTYSPPQTASLTSVLLPTRRMVYEYSFVEPWQGQNSFEIMAYFAVPPASRQVGVVLAGNVMIALVFLGLAYVASAVWATRTLQRPLELMRQAQEQLAHGESALRVPDNSPINEVQAISNSFNHMSVEIERYRVALLDKTRLLEDANEQYRALNADLEHQVDEKTADLREFFSLVTHELKVPLAAIKGYTELLLRGKDDLTERQREHLKGIGTATWHLLQLVRNMTETVKYDVQEPRYYREAVDLEELARDVESHLAPALAERSVTVLRQVAPAGLLIHADRTRLGQVLINLLANAIQYTPEGGTVELHAHLRGGLVQVQIVDHGSGIEPSDLPRLFQKFTRLGSREDAKGLGLGLYIVRRMLEGHGSEIAASSEKGVGTTFTFDIQAATGADKADSEG